MSPPERAEELRDDLQGTGSHFVGPAFELSGNLLVLQVILHIFAGEPERFLQCHFFLPFAAVLRGRGRDAEVVEILMLLSAFFLLIWSS